MLAGWWVSCRSWVYWLLRDIARGRAPRKRGQRAALSARHGHTGGWPYSLPEVEASALPEDVQGALYQEPKPEAMPERDATRQNVHFDSPCAGVMRSPSAQNRRGQGSFVGFGAHKHGQRLTSDEMPPPLAVLIVAVFTAIAVAGSPPHHLRHGRASLVSRNWCSSLRRCSPLRVM
jgi:hypothetical protein